jgi:hypothetical protein
MSVTSERSNLLLWDVVITCVLHKTLSVACVVYLCNTALTLSVARSFIGATCCTNSKVVLKIVVSEKRFLKTVVSEKRFLKTVVSEQWFLEKRLNNTVFRKRVS